MIPQARAIRYYAEQKGRSSWIDQVSVSTNDGGFTVAYDVFRLLFELEIPKGGEIAFQVKTKQIDEKKCFVAR